MDEEFEVGTRLSFYARVSTDKEDQANSLENQKSFFERVYISKNRYITSEKCLYFDEGITGTKLKRPDFDRMLFDAGLDIVEVRNRDNDGRKEYLDYVTLPSSTRKPKFDVIIIKTTSRFARNINAFKILQQLRQKKVYVYFWDKKKYTKRENDLTDIQRYLLADEEESRTKSIIVSFGMKESAYKGIIRTGGNPFGYKYIKEENRLEIVEEEAEMVRKVYQWYLEGNGIKRIIKKLTDEGYYNRKGHEFTINTIKRMLSNEKYIGWSVRNKLDHGKVFERNSYPKVKPEEEWIVNKETGKIPPIIKKEDFFKVKEIRENNINYKINKGIYRGVSEFASKIYCGKCGKVYHKNVDKGRHYYNCSSKRKYGTDKCNNRNIYVKEIEELITPENYRKSLYNVNIDIGKDIVTLVYKLAGGIKQEDKEKVSKLNVELDELKERRQRILKMYEMNYINDIELQHKIEPINNKIEHIEKNIYYYSKNNDEIMKDLTDLLDIIEILKADNKKLTEMSNKQFANENPREMIVKDIKKIIVRPDGGVWVSYHTYEKYVEIKEKYKDLLSIYVKGGDVIELIKKLKVEDEDWKKRLYDNDIIKKIV